MQKRLCILIQSFRFILILYVCSVGKFVICVDSETLMDTEPIITENCFALNWTGATMTTTQFFVMVNNVGVLHIQPFDAKWRDKRGPTYFIIHLAERSDTTK